MKLLSSFGLIGIMALGAVAVSSLAIASQFNTSPNTQSRTANLAVARSSVQGTTTKAVEDSPWLKEPFYKKFSNQRDVVDKELPVPRCLNWAYSNLIPTLVREQALCICIYSYK